MKWIRQQEQRVSQSRFGRGQHGRLSPAVGMAAQEDAAWSLLSEGFHRAMQALLVTLSTARLRRSVGPQLAERQIAAKYREPGSTAGIRDCHEERRLAVRSSTVGKDKATDRGI